MDAHFQPINGISLERYADLGAAIADDMNDAAKVAAVLETEGVTPADWEAAKKGWTARMQDMSLMGRVATAYMPMYQAALAKRKGGRASASYEDFVAVSAAIKVLGFEVALRACEVKSSDWTEVAGHWTQTMGQQMMHYAGHHDLVGREEARIRSGGAPRKVVVTRESRPASSPETTLPSAGAQVMQNPLGFGLAQVSSFLTGAVMPGSSVVVTHPTDGQRYPGRVLSTAPQQTLVQFPNGSQQWVPAHAVARA